MRILQVKPVPDAKKAAFEYKFRYDNAVHFYT